MMIYVVFHNRLINIHMSLNETKHMRTIMAGLCMMIYMCFLLRCTRMLVFPKVVEYLYTCITEYDDRMVVFSKVMEYHVQVYPSYEVICFHAWIRMYACNFLKLWNVCKQI
jgi:hypothetical protein